MTDYQAKTASIIGEAQIALTNVSIDYRMINIRLLSDITTLGLDAKLYSCQIEKGGTLVRDFVPCTNPSGEAGLYDLVGNQFYANTRTGTLTAGPAV